MATVVELITYPVKGCAGTSVDSTHVTPAGLAHDRSFMVVSVDGVYRTQRRYPRLALVLPTVTADGSRLTLASAEPGAVTARCTSTSPPPRPGAMSTCSARRTRASTRARKLPSGSRTSSAPRAVWSAYRPSTTGRPTA